MQLSLQWGRQKNGTLNKEKVEVNGCMRSLLNLAVASSLDNCLTQIVLSFGLLVCQANIRIMETVASRLGISMDKVRLEIVA